MSVRITRDPADAAVVAVRDCLAGYVATHPGASADLYRRGTLNIAVRVVDPGFAGTERLDRHGRLWHYLADRLPDEVMQEVGVLLTVTPAEAKTVIGSLEFDDPYLATTGIGLSIATQPTSAGSLFNRAAPPAGGLFIAGTDADTPAAP